LKITWAWPLAAGSVLEQFLADGPCASYSTALASGSGTAWRNLNGALPEASPGTANCDGDPR